MVRKLRADNDIGMRFDASTGHAYANGHRAASMVNDCGVERRFYIVPCTVVVTLQ